MSWANYDDALGQLREGGLIVDALEIDTPRPKRCLVEGADREKRGWYWLTSKAIGGETYITGAFGVYHGNDNGKQTLKLRLDGKAVELSEDERAAIRARHAANMKRLKALRQAEADRAAHEAQRVWLAYLPTGTSDYLERKGVGAHGVRFAPSGNGTLAVPMLRDGRVVGLQIIRGRDRGKKLEKQYWPAGMDKVGAYHLLGRPVPGGVVAVAEGYATGATVFEALAGTLAVAIAFDAGSLLPVSTALARTYRTARLVVLADDDYRTPGNPGVTAARDAAEAVGGVWLAPSFGPQTERPMDGPKKPTDWNDLMLLEGQHVVRAQLEALLSGQGWSANALARAEPTPGEAGARGALPSMIQLAEAVDRYAMIYGSGGTWFDGELHMLVPKSDLQDILPEHGMRDMRALKRVVRMDQVGFDPGGEDDRIVCNLWAGWPTVPKPGRCERLLELLQYLCSEEEQARDVYRWVLQWIAYPMQNPGAKMRQALVFHGSQGAGKNLFFETVMSIYGEYGRIIDQHAVEDKFNDWASRKLFLIADEVVARQELYHVKNKLKSFITGEWIRINPKNVAAHDERNHVNIVFLSNEAQPLSIEAGDRRFLVIRTPEKLSSEFYAEVRAEIQAGGRAALHDHLLNLDLKGFEPYGPPPMTRAKEAVIDLSLSSPERFFRDWHSGEVRFGEDALPFCPASTTDLYSAYVRWCRANGVARPREANHMLGELELRPGWRRGLKDRYDAFGSSRLTRQRMIVPSEADLSQAVLRGAADYRRGPAETQTEWMTRCFFDFRNALGAEP